MQNMQPTMKILERIYQNSEKNKNEVFTRLYRYLLRPDIYYVAYKNLYSNNGAATPGVEQDTADGFGKAKIERIIASLSDGSYEPRPARRTYIPKKNGKKRPLGLPTFTDKLVQESIRLLLEAIFEPTFQNTSHGFRPNRSCHTAMGQITKGFNGIRWFIEGDIKGCFDNIDHDILLTLIERKIKDARFIQLIRKFLKAGYMEEWRYHRTYSGTPQGGIISPILSNIYLHELDCFVQKMQDEFDQPKVGDCTPEYAKLINEGRKLKRRMAKATPEEIPALRNAYSQIRKQKLKTPYKPQNDKKIKYVRYADDFLIGVNGSKEDCERIKAELTRFIRDRLNMELSAEKTLITHSSQTARFLGYDIRVRRSGQIKQSGMGFTKRTLNNKVELLVPLEEKITRFLFDKHIVRQDDHGRLLPICRNNLLRCSELEIISAFNAEIRGLCGYYCMASNYTKLNYFAYLMEYSCLKTLAGKHKSSVAKTIEKYRIRGESKWAVPYTTKAGDKLMSIAKAPDCKRTANDIDTIKNHAVYYANSVTTFEARLKAKTCELCGSTDAACYEIHHVNKVKNLAGKEAWERIMIAKKRKTMVLCLECHKRIHGKKE